MSSNIFALFSNLEQIILIGNGLGSELRTVGVLNQVSIFKTTFGGLRIHLETKIHLLDVSM